MEYIGTSEEYGSGAAQDAVMDEEARAYLIRELGKERVNSFTFCDNKITLGKAKEIVEWMKKNEDIFKC